MKLKGYDNDGRVAGPTNGRGKNFGIKNEKVFGEPKKERGGQGHSM